MLGKKRSTFSRKEFLDKELKRSGAYGSWAVAYSTTQILDKFAKSIQFDNIDDYLIEVKAELKEEPDSDIAVRTLDDFASFLTESGKMPATVTAYVSKAKKYMRLVHSIRLSKEDVQDYVTLPVDVEPDEEKEPLTKDDIIKIVNCSTGQRRKAFYMFLKDTGARIGEGLQVKKKYFNFSVNPVKVLFPQSIVKGKKRKRYVFLTHETANFVKPVLDKLEDGDLVFTSNPKIVWACAAERDAFNYMRDKIGMTDKYSHNRRFKKTIHSFRAFTYTQSKLATGDADYAHGYIGHDRYLITYERIEESEKIDLFNRCTPRLSIFEDVVVLSNEEVNEKTEKMQEQIDSLMKKLGKLEEVQQGAKEKARFGDKITITDLRDIEN